MLVTCSAGHWLGAGTGRRHWARALGAGWTRALGGAGAWLGAGAGWCGRCVVRALGWPGWEL